MSNNTSFEDLINVSKLSWEMSETVRLLKGSPGTMYQESSETDRTIFRDWIRGLLQRQTVTVTFAKADGSIRDMQCTLDFSKIPEDKLPKGDVPVEHLLKEEKLRKPSEEHNLRVFDVEKQEWRSFRFDRLQKLSVTLQFDK